LKKDVFVKKIDLTTPEHQAEIERMENERREALRRQEEAERKRLEEEKASNTQVRRELARVKYPRNQPKLEYTPSRLVDVDTDVEIMNMSEELKSVKETVEGIESILWDIADYLFRKDKKKREALRLKRYKRSAKR
jgi:hypothetical protein